jgi:hypothetical protein
LVVPNIRISSLKLFQTVKRINEEAGYSDGDFTVMKKAGLKFARSITVSVLSADVQELK